MRVVVVGATGNVGTSVLRSVADEPAIESVLGVARRRPATEFAAAEWAAADITGDDLVPLFRGADAVVHLAWAIQPSRDLATLRRINVDGSARVFRAVADAGVPALVYASSVGTYAAGPKDRFVDEDWPATGITTSFYSRHKAEVEGLLDRFGQEHPAVRTVRLRPGLIFKREAASGIRRLFAGPFVPSPLVRPDLVPFVADHPRLRFQGVHSLDVGDAYRRAIVSDARGAFNLAAEPVLGPAELARVLRARRIPVPGGVLRGVVALAWNLRLQPTPPGWVDLALGVPLLDSSRARRELEWSPQHRADEALAELLQGIRDGAGSDTPALARETGGPARIRELLTGVGGRQ